MAEGVARDSIESANAPLAFKATGDIPLSVPSRNDSLLLHRVATQALVGMQKEALLVQSGEDTIWRMVCDEGPYLNGTDLAPPPLAYFSAGMASTIASTMLDLAKEHGIELDDLRIVQDNMYSMEGSAARGTMIAGALPVELTVHGKVAKGDVTLQDLVLGALAKSPADALMRDELVDTFSITRNGHALAPNVVTASENQVPADPVGLFSGFRYDSDKQAVTDAVSKLESTESVFEADHGAGAAMKDTQKRRLQIRSILTLRDDGLREIKVQIFKPIGSVFRFLSDDSPACGGEGRAPSGLALMSAGIAFCYMTQLGRYAGIVKKNLESYGVVQDMAYDLAEGKTMPIDTHVYITTSEDEETTQVFVDMGEQTCFLHGACRMSNKTRISIRPMR